MSEVFNFRGITSGVTVSNVTLDDWEAAHAYGTALRLGDWAGEHAMITNADESREIYTYDPPDQA